MSNGRPPANGSVNSVKTPPGVTRPIFLPAYSVNQMFPSGPVVIPYESPPEGIGSSVMTPDTVMRQMLVCEPESQRLPSGPAVINLAPGDAGGRLNSVRVPAGVRRP